MILIERKKLARLISLFLSYILNANFYFLRLDSAALVHLNGETQVETKFNNPGTMNYPKKPGFNLYESRYCAYITYSVKTWFLKILFFFFIR